MKRLLAHADLALSDENIAHELDARDDASTILVTAMGYGSHAVHPPLNKHGTIFKKDSILRLGRVRFMTLNLGLGVMGTVSK